MIYRCLFLRPPVAHLVPSDSYLWGGNGEVKRGQHSIDFNRSPEILRTNRQVYHEAHPVLYTELNIVIIPMDLSMHPINDLGFLDDAFETYKNLAL